MAQTLSDYLKQTGKKVEEFAREISVDPDSVYRYRNGTRRPKHDVMLRIVKVTRGAVTADSFLSQRRVAA